jgi:uncharacterized membrane protein
MTDWSELLARWSEAGLIDPETAARIREFEREHAGSTRLRWPILVALAFGALLVAGGILLFVAAHWDALSPGERFAVVVVLVAAFHIFGALTADRFPGLGSAFHAIGTTVLGAGIFLAGQIFNLEEHWPGGVLLWAGGAAIAWALLRETPQLVLTAILTPAWLAGEWMVATGDRLNAPTAHVLAYGIFLLAVAYFTAAGPERPTIQRRALVWLGGLSLIPALLFLLDVTVTHLMGSGPTSATSAGLAKALGWTVAVGGPLAVAFLLRRLDAWPMLVAVAWGIALLWMRSIGGPIAVYAWWALGAVGLVAWGIRDLRSERVNMGTVVFAATVVTFYFSEVMDKLGRSASLVGLGLLFLAGGWALERVRRRLVLQARGRS